MSRSRVARAGTSTEERGGHHEASRSHKEGVARAAWEYVICRKTPRRGWRSLTMGKSLERTHRDMAPLDDERSGQGRAVVRC